MLRSSRRSASWRTSCGRGERRRRPVVNRQRHDDGGADGQRPLHRRSVGAGGIDDRRRGRLERDRRRSRAASGDGRQRRTAARVAARRASRRERIRRLAAARQLGASMTRPSTRVGIRRRAARDRGGSTWRVRASRERCVQLVEVVVERFVCGGRACSVGAARRRRASGAAPRPSRSSGPRAIVARRQLHRPRRRERAAGRGCRTAAASGCPSRRQAARLTRAMTCCGSNGLTSTPSQPACFRPRLVDRLERAGQQEHGNVRQLGSPFTNARPRSRSASACRCRPGRCRAVRRRCARSPARRR